jgi:hypothetical protein
MGHANIGTTLNVSTLEPATSWFVASLHLMPIAESRGRDRCDRFRIFTEDEALRKVSSEQAPSPVIEHGTDRNRVGFAGGGGGRRAGHGASRKADDGRGTE